jgi:S2P endopeptidase
MNLTILILICVMYGIVMFLDFFFRSCMMLPYLDLLKTTGITVKFFRIQFHTNLFNRFVNRHSSKMPIIYRHSFKVGFYCTMILLPIALSLMIASLFTGSSSVSSAKSPEISGSSVKRDETAHLEILLPGLNLPLSQMGYYVLALLVCSVVHEAGMLYIIKKKITITKKILLGHGIAAVLEDIPVAGFGMQLFFILPIAYTQIDTDHLQTARLWKKLKIYSAGIWNNILLTGLCYMLLLLLPLFLYPIYSTKEAVFITNIRKNAAIRGENGLYIGDSIELVNGCKVTTEDEWIECLTESLLQHPAYCVSEEFVHENDESIHEIEHQKGLVNCCPSNTALNCFENFDEERLPQFMCLNIRNTVEHLKSYCHREGLSCAEHFSCIKPILPNSSTIIHIKRKNRAKDFVYYGHPYDILSTTDISEFVPKTKFFEPAFADALALMLKYLIVFSSGLAIVNVIPCYGLDGQFLSNAIISNLPSRYFTKAKKEIISISVNLLGTLTLFLAVIKIVFTTFL